MKDVSVFLRGVYFDKKIYLKATDMKVHNDNCKHLGLSLSLRSSFIHFYY